MERMILFKSPDIPDDLLYSAGRDAFELRVLNPSEDFSMQSCATAPGFVLDWAFYINNKKLISKMGLSDESVLIVYNPEQADELELDCRIFEFVRVDRPVAFKISIQSLKRNISLKQEYEKAHNLNKELLSIGIALSAERNNDKLLNDILYKIRQITRADAGSLYLLEKVDGTDEQNLLFKIAHNDSNPSDFSEFRMPLNTKSIAGYVAVTSKVLNIPDAYVIPDAEPYSFNKSYDLATNYRTCSILTVPMLDHQENTIGVIQLINRKRCFEKVLGNISDIDMFVEPFDDEDENIVLSLASQAAVSLENNILYNEIETLFEGFVAASVKAIESRDPSTSGHSSRVSAYSVETAKAINSETTGKFADVFFSDDQLKELRYAGLLHDFGKVGVREKVLIKAKKLYPGHLDLLRMRFAYIRKCAELEYERHGDKVKLKNELQELDAALEVIAAADEPSVTGKDPSQQLKEYNRKHYTSPEGVDSLWLTDDELELLTITKGCLTVSERKEIESHVEHSTDFLNNIPWTTGLRGLPGIARGHHERMDGTGYPDGISAEKLSLQSRIMAVADIYDALTASDRPYKRAIPEKIALKIIVEEAENKHLDHEIVDIFISKKIYEFGVNK